VRRALVILLGPAAALAAAAPAAAAEVQVQGLDTLTWDKPALSISVGDTVRWTFAGTTQPHNVQSTSPNWAPPVDSPSGVPTPDVTHTFAAEGVYTYVCKIHATTMTGTITVGSPPPPPPPPLSEQPFPNDTAITTGSFEIGGVDVTDPKLRGVRVKRAGKRVRVAFKVSEQSVVTVKLTRHGKTLAKKRARTASRGRVTFGKLAAGRYRVALTARDAAGNTSSRKSARVTVR
jgi:plastocyanin